MPDGARQEEAPDEGGQSGAGGDAGRFGRFALVAPLGAGGTGIVWKARDGQTGRLVALKRPRDEAPISRALLRQEAAMLARLGRARPHPGVVALVANGADEDPPWYAMECLVGEDLGAFVRRIWAERRAPGERPEAAVLTATVAEATELLDPRGTHAPVEPLAAARAAAGLPPCAGGRLDEALRIVRAVAEALAFVHGHGIVHGDLTPRNVILRAGGGPVLVDFGTALSSSAGETAREIVQVEGRMLGTPAYMAPEQIRRQRLDARCDLYALGCVLFELLTGRPPFVGGGASAILAQHLRLAPPTPEALADGVPPALAALVARLLEKDVAARLGHAEEVVEALDVLLGEPGRAAAPRGAPGPLYRPRLAGRGAVLAGLTARLQEAAAGRGGLLLVGGESGVGKTRIANELGGAAIGLGFEVVTGGCVRPGRAPDGAAPLRPPPLEPLRPFLRALADRPPAELARPGAPLAEALAAVAPYEPALARRTGIPALPDLGPERGRRRLFRSVAALLSAFAARTPLLLVLDDLQAADDLTLALLGARELAGLADARVLVLGTYREEDREALRPLLDATAPEARVRLGRLSQAEIRAMAKDMLAAPALPDGLAERLYRQSEGNPFFAAEFLRAACARGELARGAGGAFRLVPPEGAAAALEAAHHPEALRALFALRLEALSPAARRLLELAAVLGREFRADALEGLEGAGARLPPAADLPGALEELVARQILEAPAPGRFRFVHDKLREAQEQALAQGRRRELHLAVALRLEAAGDAAAVDAGELGTHWAAAGAPARAFSLLERGAAEAEAALATGRATDLYRLALAQAQAASAPEAAGRTAEALGDLLVRTGLHEEARRRYDEALAVAPPDDLRTRARLLRKTGQSYSTRHEYAEAGRALAQAAEALGPLDAIVGEEARREWIEIQQNRFSLKYFARETGPETTAMLRALAPVVEAHGAPLQRTIFFQCALSDVLGRGRYAFSEEALGYATRALASVEPGERALPQLVLAHFGVGFVLLLGSRAQCAEALPHLQAAEEGARRLEDALQVSRALLYRTIAHRRLGDLDGTARAAEAARAAAERCGVAPYVAGADACLAWIAWHRGEPEAARALVAAAARTWRDGAHAFPFRWLGDLVAVALSEAPHGDAPACAARLLAPDQQQLPDRLEAALRALSEAASPGARAAGAARVIAEARVDGHL